MPDSCGKPTVTSKPIPTHGSGSTTNPSYSQTDNFYGGKPTAERTLSAPPPIWTTTMKDKQAFIDAMDLQQDLHGDWYVRGNIRGDVLGDVEGNVGNVLGDVIGNVGWLNGNIYGRVWTFVRTEDE